MFSKRVILFLGTMSPGFAANLQGVSDPVWKAQVPGVDWAVTALYAAAMLAIGWHYSRRARTADDYLLGGREMKSSAIGLSLFATLVSSVSYLSWPGEMIQHGPMMLAQIGAYPVIAFVVGRYLIPRFMRLRVTSAYELLESRFNVGVRLLGALIFVGIRLLWMGMIIHATAVGVLQPVLHLSPAVTPWVSLALVAVTVTYSTMGGLRAVVVTDVVQTFIMLAGAAVTLLLITDHLGGIGAWWPREWNEAWDEPILWFDADRRTFAGAFLTSALWWICTAGSDQLAIQRYLSTPDARTARRAFSISLVADGCSTVLMLLVGMALLAYFQAAPQLLPAGYSLATHGDRLFPLYIAHGLPVGFSGLVIAALLAAAMSSLSSGINSATTVITADFISRFRRHQTGRYAQVRTLRIISVLIGVTVVLVSLGVNRIEGNLLEVCYRMVNLLVGPLAVLFFMALLVPWATSFGAIVAAAAGTTAAVGIAHLHVFNLGFLWILPVSVSFGLASGMLASLLPVGRPPRPVPLAE